MATASKHALRLRASNAKLISAVFLAMVALIAYFVATSYYSSLEKSKTEVLERLKAIAFTSVWLLNGDEHDSLANNLMTKDAITENHRNRIYNKLHSTLKAVYETNHLESPLYTIVYYAKDSTFHFIATSSDKPYYRHSYKNYPKDLLKNYNTGGTLDSYFDENGKWLSAFAPLKNSKGEVVALLEADENFEIFVSKAKQELRRNTLISMAVLLPFTLLLFTYLTSTLKKHTEDQEMLVHQKEEIEAQNEEIKTQSDFIEKQNKELDQRVRQRTAELEKSNTELANFLYHSSHDVQAPIATLKGLESLAIQETKEPLTKEYLTLIKDTTAKLERMVKTIQLVHHIKTTQLSFESVNLYEKTNQIFNSLSHNNVQLEINLSNDIAINTDARLLENFISELFKNSIQYNQGNINLKIRLTAQYSNEGLNLLIEDNGIGISAEARKDLFTMFKRGNEKSTGIGLGLYIAQICIERMSGQISIKESNQAGAHFQISLPA